MDFVLSKWSLDDLYPSDSKEKFLSDLNLLEQKTTAFQHYRAELSADMPVDKFLAILNEYEAINEMAQRLNGYTHLLFAADTRNSAVLSQMVQTRSRITVLSNTIMFFELWFCELTDEESGRFITAAEGFRHYLTCLHQSKPHTLCEQEEKIINTKDMTGKNALVNLYNTITNRYVFTPSISTEEKHLTRGELMTYARSEIREERKAAYEEMYRVYANDSTILGQIYQSIARDWDQEKTVLRQYASPISARNLSNDIPDEIVDLLLNTCRKNKGIFADFFRWKKQTLELDEFHRFDLYAPIGSDDKKVSFDKALHIVLDSYSCFDQEFSRMAESIYNARHIDSEIRHGKRSGAFCSTVSPKHTPWVLVNFQGKLDDIFTLAHELGHGIHSLSAADKNSFEQHACLPLAETASTFGEMLLSDYLEQRVTDPSALRNLLAKELDDNYATIMRQSYFAIFEKQAHRMIMEGADIHQLSDAYLDNLREQFDGSVITDDYFRWEWTAIPHIFHTPFYVYAYSFGQLLVLSLYNQYKTEGKTFIPRYKEMLRKGGSQQPGELLKEAGFDFTKESFWQGGFDILKGKLERLKGLS